jgi:N-acetylglucosamine kinase-like BadF-type ATPase
MSEQVVIGIDGGGTRLRAAIVSCSGELLGLGEGGSGNYHDVGANQVRTNISEAVSQAWTAFDNSPREVAAIFLGLGSIVTREDQEAIREIVTELALVPADLIGVDHDLRVALMGGLAGETGIVLIAGTGSSCYGRDKHGNSWQSGGWGPTLDDPGSSFWLGRMAMVAAIRDYDGRGEATMLRDGVIDALELSDIRQILRRVELLGMTRSEVAALARLVTESAAEGDSVACQIIQQGTDELAKMVAAVADKLTSNNETTQPIPVVVTGGLTSARQVFMNPLTQSLRCIAPTAILKEAFLPPVLGAALLAMELTGERLSSSIVNTLEAEYSAVKHVCSVK